MTTTERTGKTGQRQPIPSRERRAIGETGERLPRSARPEESIAAARRRALYQGLGGRSLLLSGADVRVLQRCCDETARSAGDDPCLCNYVELL